ncbi:MAG: VanZ family protein [Planctomycetes bacterium]|nr:VanZ family protein [Planctomycetota bacterium]
MTDHTPLESARDGSVVRQALWWALLATWGWAVWTLSASSHPQEDLHWRWAMPDKLAHGLEYAAGGFIARAALASSFRRVSPWPLAVLVCAAWGFTDEIHQGFVPGRVTDPWDLAADVTGAAVGASIHAAVSHLRRSLRSPARPSR